MKLPERHGQAVVFTAHGQTFNIVKIGREFCLNLCPAGPRNRWGNADEIRADIAHCMETGRLPQANGGRW